MRRNTKRGGARTATYKKRSRMLDKLLAIYERDKWVCICGNSVHQFGTPQIAHRLAQTKANLKKWGEEIIHHPINLVATCSLKCNAKASTSNWREVFEEMAGDQKLLEILKEKGYERI